MLDEKTIPYKHLQDDDLIRETAQSLAEGKLVCWFQGRMEWGPRALGSRKLTNEFYQITGIPCILNTSYNVQEPIVCTPQDAVSTFLRTTK